MAAIGLMALASACAEQAAPRTFCRFVPERSDDFAWENDMIAFRVYGPALRAGKESGGVDCWLKRVDYPIIDKWYQKHVDGGSYHKDSGEGYDPYHVGSSLGCGGIGLWLDGRLETSNTFVDWKVIQCEPKESVFELNYAWDVDGHSYKQTKRITIKLGDRLFHTVSTFWKDGELAKGLPVAVGLTTHDGKAKASGDIKTGVLACWEEIDGSDLGTGVVMDPSAIGKYKQVKSEKPDESHALFITETDDQGQVSWWAGYGWERAEAIESSSAWKKYLKQFSKKN